MPLYTIIEKATGKVVYHYQSDTPQEYVGFEFATFAHVPSDVEPVQPAQTEPQVWTPLEFLRRFTPVERTAIRNYALTDPMAEDFMFMLDHASEIRSDDPDVKLGVWYMGHVGVIDSTRVSQIMGV